LIGQTNREGKGRMNSREVGAAARSRKNTSKREKAAKGRKEDHREAEVARRNLWMWNAYQETPQANIGRRGPSRRGEGRKSWVFVGRIEEKQASR